MNKRVAIYARVSTPDQNPALQVDELRRYTRARGWTVAGVYMDKVSGAKERRPALDEMMTAVRRRLVDTVLVWRFDRFARSAKHLLAALEEFRTLGVEFISYQEQVDTATPMGKVVFTLAAAFAELERNIIRERVQIGVNRARKAKGTWGRGRSPFDLKTALELKAKGLGVRAIGRQLGVPHSRVGRRLQEASRAAGKAGLKTPLKKRGPLRRAGSRF